MKKIITLLLTLVLLVTPLMSISAAAPEATSYLEGPMKVESGAEFEVTYSLEGDEIRAADGKIIYNMARVDLISVDLDAAGWIIEYEAVDDGILFAVANETGKRAITEKTAVFTVTLQARTTTGTAGISAAFQNVANGKGAMVTLEDTEYTDPNAKKDEDTTSSDTSSEDTNNNQGGSNQDNQGGAVIVPPVTDGPSKDFTLKSLEVAGYKLVQKDDETKGFDPEVKTYVLTVPFSVEKLDIKAEVNDANATVEISEAELVYVGTNITKIVVTAENGSKRTYKIYTTRLAPEDEGEGNDTDAPAEEGLGWWLWVIIGGAALLLALIIIIIIIILKKKKN